MPIGSFLGEMTNELEDDYGPGAYISRFASGGPKNYGYEVTIPGQEARPEVYKVKGITPTRQTTQRLNFWSIREMVKNFVANEPQVIELDQTRIGRIGDRQVATIPLTKKYRVVYDKRVVKADYTTLPYGF